MSNVAIVSKAKGAYKYEESQVLVMPEMPEKKKRQILKKELLANVMGEYLSQNSINKLLSKLWDEQDSSLIALMELSRIDVSKIDKRVFNTKAQIKSLSEWHKQFVLLSFKNEGTRTVTFAVDKEGKRIKKQVVSVGMVFIAIKNLIK